MERTVLESPNLNLHICLAFCKDLRWDGTSARADWAPHLAEQEARETGDQTFFFFHKNAL